MSVATPLAEVRELSELVGAFRTRAEQLNAARDTLDSIAGLTTGHFQKLLADPPVKNFGMKTLGPVLGTLGLKLLVVEDPEAMARVQRRMTPRIAKMSRLKMNGPAYRALEANTSFGLAMFPAGALISYNGWPKVACGKIEPVNEEAKRIHAYWLEKRGQFGLPDAPFDPVHGRMYLPHHLPHDPRSTRLPPLPAEELPGMPRYRATWQQAFGNREVKIGDEFAFCGWPVAGLEPINAEAREAVGYLEQHRGHPKMLSCPWCDYARALFLPDLPEVPKQTYARDVSEPYRDSWNDQINAERLNTARKQLQQAAHKQRSNGPRRRVSA